MRLCVCVCVYVSLCSPPPCVPQLSPQQYPRWLGLKGTTLWRAPHRGRHCQSPSPLSLWSSSSCTAPLGGCCLHATKWIAAASGTFSSPLPPQAPVERGWLDSVLLRLAVPKSVCNGRGLIPSLGAALCLISQPPVVDWAGFFLLRCQSGIPEKSLGICSCHTADSDGNALLLLAGSPRIL